MARRANPKNLSLTELISRYESQRAELAQAKAALAEISGEIRARLDASAVGDEAHEIPVAPKARRGRPPGASNKSKKKAKTSVKPAKRARRGKAKRLSSAEWKAKRDSLFGKMKSGKIYRGEELENMAPIEAGAATFIKQIREPLLQSKKLKKVTEDGGPWTKGMSPRSVRWIAVLSGKST